MNVIWNVLRRRKDPQQTTIVASSLRQYSRFNPPTPTPLARPIQAQRKYNGFSPGD
jgi:hypothetical protein